MLLAKVFKADPGNEVAWLWMSAAVSSTEQRRQCPKCGFPIGESLIDCSHRRHDDCSLEIHITGVIDTRWAGWMLIFVSLPVAAIVSNNRHLPTNLFTTLFCLLFKGLGFYLTLAQRISLENRNDGSSWEQTSLLGLKLSETTTSPRQRIIFPKKPLPSLQFLPVVIGHYDYRIRRQGSIAEWVDYAAEVLSQTLFILAYTNLIQLHTV